MTKINQKLIQKEICQHLKTLTEPCEKAHKFSYFLNPDNTVRWIWPSDATQPNFLKFYAISGLKSKLFATACKAVFSLKTTTPIF